MHTKKIDGSGKSKIWKLIMNSFWTISEKIYVFFTSAVHVNAEVLLIITVQKRKEGTSYVDKIARNKYLKNGAVVT